MLLDQQMNLPHVHFRHFSNCFFLLALWRTEITCKSCKRQISVSYSTLWTLDVRPIGFPNQISGLSLLSDLGVRMPHVGYQPLAPSREEPVRWGPFLLCVASLRVGFFCETIHVSVSTTHLDVWSFYPLLWRAVYLVIRSFSEGNDPYETVDLVCLWERSFRIFYVAILDYPPPAPQNF